MSYYEQQEYEFVKRTKAILEQYDKFLIKLEEKYEVTLFINCFVGLLFLPREYWFNNLPNGTVSEKNWGINANDISFIKKGEEKSVQNVTKHLRNSIAHYRFKDLPDDNNNIYEFEF